MNDKDKEAFNEWRNSISTRLDIHDAWQAACEYMQAELAYHIFKIEAENKKLREKLETAKIIFIEMNDKDKEILEWREAARSEAEEVNRLQTENKKLREALIKIANDRSPPWDKMDYQDIAREALK